MFDTFSNLFLYFKTILSTVLIVSSFFCASDGYLYYILISLLISFNLITHYYICVCRIGIQMFGN